MSSVDLFARVCSSFTSSLTQESSVSNVRITFRFLNEYLSRGNVIFNVKLSVITGPQFCDHLYWAMLSYPNGQQFFTMFKINNNCQNVHLS